MKNCKTDKKQGFAAHPETINRKGRPRNGQTLSGAFREMLDKKYDNKRTYREMIRDRIFNIISNGEDTSSLIAIRDLLNRLEGMPRQSIDVSQKVYMIIDPNMEDENGNQG